MSMRTNDNETGKKERERKKKKKKSLSSADTGRTDGFIYLFRVAQTGTRHSPTDAINEKDIETEH